MQKTSNFAQCGLRSSRRKWRLVRARLIRISAAESGRSVSPFAKTTMITTLPPEILDLIIDHLYGKPVTLKACCLVSKSFVPRSRRHIFARVQLSPQSARSWVKAFPDSSNSPAHYTRILRIRNLGAYSTYVPSWVLSFCNVEELSMNNDTVRCAGLHQISLLQLHGLSPTLKVLRLSGVFTSISETLGFICSFPLLEDLSLRPIFESENDGPAPPTSPKLTGSFRLYDQNRPIARRLLELPDGLHFSEIWVYSDSRAIDSRTITDLVLKCSDTLETLHLSYSLSGAFPLVFAADWFLTTRYSRTQMITKRNLHLTSPTP